MKRRMSDTQKEVMHTNTNHSPTETITLIFSVFSYPDSACFLIRIRIQTKIFYDKNFNEKIKFGTLVLSKTVIYLTVCLAKPLQGTFRLFKREIYSFIPFWGASFGLPGSGSKSDHTGFLFIFPKEGPFWNP